MHTLRRGLSCSTKGKVNNAMLQRALTQYQTESYLLCFMILKSGNLIVSTVCCSSSSHLQRTNTGGSENEHWRLVEDRNGQVGYAPAAFLMVILDTTAEEEESSATKKGQENSTDENQIGGWVGQEGERRKSYSAAVIDGIKRNSRIYVGDSIVRKTDTRLSKEEDVVVCLPGARIEHVTERVEKIMGRGKGGTILVHIGTNNADKEGTTAIVDKYRKLLKKTKEARVEQIILSGNLPVFGNRLDGYRNAKRMAINGMVKRLCMEEDVGYVDLWDSLVGKEEMYARDGLHLSGKGAAVFAEGLSGAVASGLGKVRYLN